MTRKRVIISRILMVLYLAAVAYLCFANFQSLPNVDRTMFGFPTDKVVHFLMFFPFPIIAFFCYDKMTDKVWKALVWLAITLAIGCAFAGATEIIQGKLVYRAKDIHDFRADALALGISGAIVFAVDVLDILLKKRKTRRS